MLNRKGVMRLGATQVINFNDRSKVWYSAKVGVFDYQIYEDILQNYNLFTYGKVVYVYEDGYYKEDKNGTILKTIIRNRIPEEYIKSGTIDRIHKLFLQDVSLVKEYNELNNYPHHWICFQNGMYDCKSNKMIPHDPEYLCINQIPHNYEMSKTPQNHNRIEEFLDFVCEKSDDRQMLLEYIGYSMTTDTSQQRFLVLNGMGGTGKSTVIRLIEEIIGENNMSNISMIELNQRFASADLFGKILNSCADLETRALSDTSILKKVLGEDRIRGDRKGKEAIYFKNYAKLVFSTNQLPIVQNENTNGFYRRLLVLTMNRQPDKINTNLSNELIEDIDYLIYLSVKALAEMHKRKHITISKNSEIATNKLRTDSDVVQRFLDEWFDMTGKRSDTIERPIMWEIYQRYCKQERIKPLPKTYLYRSLEQKNIRLVKSGTRYYSGIKKKEGVDSH